MYNKNTVNMEFKICNRVKQKIDIIPKFVAMLYQRRYSNVAVMGQKKKRM